MTPCGVIALYFSPDAGCVRIVLSAPAAPSNTRDNLANDAASLSGGSDIDSFSIACELNHECGRVHISAVCAALEAASRSSDPGLLAHGPGCGIPQHRAQHRLICAR